jgi:cytochrome c oxidase subunit III
VSPGRTLDVSGLPVYEISNRSPIFWGQLLMAVIEGTLFLLLIAVYFYLRLGVDVWPPPGVRIPDVLWPTLALIPLAVSCVGSYMASEAAKKADRRGMIGGLVLNLVFALVFMGLRAVEWRRLNFSWNSDAHGSVVWSILFLHTYDVVADLIMTSVLIIVLAIGRYGPKQRIGVHVDSVIWYFLALIWLPLYGVLYWAPRFLGGAR